MGVPTPPMTPPRKLSTSSLHLAPIEIENYVTQTLKNQKILPPLGRDNWYKELVWLNVGILCLTPVIGLVGAYYTKLRWQTAVFGVFYYFLTGLGEKLFKRTLNVLFTPHLIFSRRHCRISSPMGSPLLQCLETVAVFPRIGRCRCS